MRRAYLALDRIQRWALQPLLVILILFGGFYASRHIAAQRRPPRPSASASYAPLVSASPVELRAHRVRIDGRGTLAARTRIGLVPQVGGEVVAIHPELRAGGRFRAGEVLLALEARDYELAVARAEADVASAETGAQDVDARASTALAEWRALHGERPAPPLVALEPQVAEARARRAAAVAALQKARLDLERTRIVARFDGRVVSASADVGQVVTPGQRIGELYALDVLEVAVPLTQEQLAWIVTAHESATPTEVALRARVGESDVTVPGRVARLEAELARDTRLGRVVVELALADVPAELALRVVPGLFVEATFAGETLADVALLPRSALRDDGVVWTVAEGRVAFARPEVVLREGPHVVVRGLAQGTQVVLSDLDVVTDGMHVRVADEGAP